jgi:apolipoprotein N-acyltransferase
LAGLLLAASMPPRGAWVAAPIGVAVLADALRDTSRPRRFLFGAAAGVALFAITLHWVTGFSAAAYLALVVFEATLFGLAMVVVHPRRGRWWTLPAALVVLEALRARFPFGGFPIPGLALSQLDGPFAAAAPLGGSLLVLAVTATAGAGATALIRSPRRVRALSTAAVAAAVVAATTAVVATAPGGGSDRSLRAVLVQGGGPRGIPAVFSDPLAVTERHFALSTAIRSGTDVVLWPENVVAVDRPIVGTSVGGRLAELARDSGASVVAGITESEDTAFRNAAVAWGPDARLLGRYDKVHRVPFGEYIPARGLVSRLSGLTALVPRDAIPGAGPGLLSTPTGPLGVVISYEVFFPDRARAAVNAGGQVLLVPTNAASYVTEDIPATEVAAARMRARELDRAVLQAAPTGYTVVIRPDGTVVARTRLGAPGVLGETVPLRTGETVYARTGDAPVLVLAGAALLVRAPLLFPRRARQGRRTDLARERE